MYRSTLQKLFLALIGVFLLAPFPAAASEQERDFIIVIDVSTSMLDHIELAKTEAKKIISAARPGDTVTIITFGRSARLLERRRIRTRGDILELVSVVEPLQATEVNTNLPVAMERSLQELRRFYEKSAGRKRVLVWLSDDRNNPPPDLPDPITFTTLKQKEVERLPVEKWFDFEQGIKPEIESDLGWFIDWANRVPMELRAKAVSRDMGTVFTSDLQKDFTIAFEPDGKAVWGTILTVAGEIRSAEYRAAVAVEPPLVVCDGAGWMQEFSVIFPRTPGEYTCTIRFSSPAETALRIEPAEIVLTARVESDMITIAEASPVTRDTTSEFDRASGSRPLMTGGQTYLPDVGQSAAKSGLLFGNVKPGKEYREKVNLYPTENIPLESIRMETNLELPAGLEIRPEFSVLDGALVAEMVLSAADDCNLPDGSDLGGEVFFVSSAGGAEIYPASVPVRITTRRPLTVELLELPGSVAEKSATMSESFFWFVPYLLVFLAGALVAFGAYRGVKRGGLRNPRLFGTLEVVSSTNGRATSYDLEKIGKRGSIMIGSSDSADISLSEPGVDDLHALLVPVVTKAGHMMFVRPLTQSKVFVNGNQYDQPKELSNDDIVAIGSAAFRYKCRSASREAIVEFRDGNCTRGVLMSWDIDEPAFEFLPKGAPSADLVNFSEIKTISFLSRRSRFALNRWSKPDRRNTGRPLEVVFEDGKMLEGYSTIQSNTWRKRFYLIPKETREIALILVERASVQQVFDDTAV